MSLYTQIKACLSVCYNSKIRKIKESLKMGNSDSQIQNQELCRQFKREQWGRNKDLGFYELWQNIRTGQLCEAYKLEYVPQYEQLQHYRFRHYNQNADNFVQIRYVDVERNRSLCSHGQSFVLTQFIPVKLLEMDGLALSQAYSILRASYRAFHTMEAFYGPFVLSGDLIGINLNGKPKIWLNKDHSKNRADTTIEAQIWQKHMGQVSQNVRKMIQMLQQRLKGKTFPSQFKNYFYDNIINFSQASEYVQEYGEKHRICIPNKIDFLKHLKDSEIIAIVNQYNNKKNSVLNERFHTLDSCQHSRSNTIAEVQGLNSLTRNRSSQNFTYQQNIHVPKTHQFNEVKYSSQNGVVFRIVPKVSNSPILQRMPLAPVQSYQNVNIRSVSQPQRKIISAKHISFAISHGELSATTCVVPLPFNNKRMNQMPRNPVTIKSQNNTTPQLIANNITFAPPHQITQLKQPERNKAMINDQVHFGQNYSNKREKSIHQKILHLESGDLRGADNNYQNQTVTQEVRPQAQDKDSGLEDYINNDQHYQSKPVKSQQGDNLTSEPDWQNLQHQRQVIQGQMGQKQIDLHQGLGERFNEAGYQVHQQRQLRGSRKPQADAIYYVDHDDLGQRQSGSNYSHRDIQPIKQGVKDHQVHLQSQNFAILSHHARQDNEEKPLEKDLHMVQPFWPLNIQNEVQSGQDQGHPNHYSNENAIDNPNFNQEQQPDGLSTSSHRHHLQNSVLSPSQKMRHVSLNNSSTNRGHIPEGQSSGTLVAHESRDKIYQGMSKRPRPLELQIADIRQQSREHQTQEQQSYKQKNNDDHRKQKRYKYVMSHQQQRTKQQNDDKNHELNNEQNGYQQFNNKKQHNYEQQKYYEQHNNGQNRMQQNSYCQSNNERQEQNTRYTQVNNSTENQRQKPQNQYENLHFRNQSDQLYQYVPLDSVCHQDAFLSNHRFQALQGKQRKQSSGNEIAQLQSQQDIEQYIRNKYSDIAGGPTIPVAKLPLRKSKQYSNRAMTFAKPASNSERSSVNKQQAQNCSQICEDKGLQNIEKNQFQPYQTEIPQQNQSENQSNVDEGDFLDVGNLQKSLDKKYSSIVIQQANTQRPSENYNNVKNSQVMSDQEGINVAALEEKLLKFEQRQSIQRQKSQAKLSLQDQEPQSQKNDELNFHQLDDIVSLMDKKIQQSQKKQQSNNTSRDIGQQKKVSQFSSRDPEDHDLGSVQMQVSKNKHLSLKYIPILKEQHLSNASNSNPLSNKQNSYRFGIDSGDFATGRDSSPYVYNSTTIKQSLKKANGGAKYEKPYPEMLSPVVQSDHRYQNYSSKNTSLVYGYGASTYVAPTGCNYESKRKSSRKNTRNNTRNNDDVKRLADQISSKYNKYIGTAQNSTSDYDGNRPFVKKRYYDSASYDSTKNQSSKYLPPHLGVQAQGMQVKRSSQLNTIKELYGQSNGTSYGWQTSLKNSMNYEKTNIPNFKSSGSLQKKHQGHFKLGKCNSKVGLDSNIGRAQTSARNYTSKVSYDQLRDLLRK